MSSQPDHTPHEDQIAQPRVDPQSLHTPPAIQNVAPEGVYTDRPAAPTPLQPNPTTKHDETTPTQHHEEESALKRDWEQTKADIPGLHGKPTGQSIADTIRGKISE